MTDCCEKVVHLELGLRALISDVHSANAAIIPSAAWRLVWALGILKDEKERVLADGLCGNGKKALNIVGLDVGYNGAGSKTIIPATACCRIDVYPTEGLCAEDICASIRAHLDLHGFEDVQVKVC